MGPSDIALLCVLVVLLLLSAFFSSAETALTTVNKIRLRTLVEEENKKAIVLNNVLNNSRKMLSTVLIGNNIVNIAASSIATIFTQSLLSDIFISVGVGILTLLIIIFGEIVPKTVASMHADEMALKYAKPISILMFVLTPVIFILNMFSNIILKLFRVKVNLNSKSITEDELRTIVGVSQEEGIIEDDEYDMITNVFDFGDACAKDIMIPKVDITMVPIDTTFEQLLDVIKTDKYTRIPVYKEDTDNIVGIINIKDMIINQVDASNFDIKKLMREPYYTHEKEELNDLLIEMRNNEPGMCIVLDEYGQAVGNTDKIEMEMTTLLKNVIVYKLQNQAMEDVTSLNRKFYSIQQANDGSEKDFDSSLVPAFVTVIVNDEQAVKLANQEYSGTVHMLLHPRIEKAEEENQQEEAATDAAKTAEPNKTADQKTAEGAKK